MTKAIIDSATGLTIHPERDENISEFSRTLIEKFYLKDGETPQSGFARAAFAWSNGDRKLAQRLLDAVSRGWFMFASPVLSNAPEVESLEPLVFKKGKGLPISCFLGSVDDTLESLINHTTELRWLSVMGGGVGGHWRKVRPASDKAPGTIPFLHTIDADMEAYKQGKVRRGSYAAYLDISHPDILEFINIRVPTGDQSRKAHSTGFHHGVNIPNSFMEAVRGNLDWDLIDPHTGNVAQTLKARTLWGQILDIRYRTGEPYLYFIDAAQDAIPEIQKKLGLETNGSNLCVTGDTLIELKDGEGSIHIRMDSFVEKFWQGKYKNPLVKSYNTETNEFVWAKVTNAGQTGTSTKLVRIKTTGGKLLECTKDHKLFTDTGWKRAEEITKDSVLFYDTEDSISEVSVVDAQLPVFDITVPETSSFVANGIVVHNCAEITLPTNNERTAVCCLSSVNLDKYDEWKDTTLVEDIIKMLDNVIQYFIETAPDTLSKAKYSAMRERSLGLGVMGFHYYLQKHMVPFESEKAREINKEIFQLINDRAIKATKELAAVKGEAPDLITTLYFHTKHGTLKYQSSDFVPVKKNGKSMVRAFEVEVGDHIEGHEVTKIDGRHSHTGWRNANLTAIAPTANSAILVQSSPSVEPSAANTYMHQTRAGTFAVKNPYLEILLKAKGINNDETWLDITTNKGSIQHLDSFSDEEKAVFKTAIEINQMWVITHAADRQPFVSQSQSINLFFPPRCSKNYVHRVHYAAWQKGMKSLYYTRTQAPNRIENVSSKLTRVALKDGDEIDATEMAAEARIGVASEREEDREINRRSASIGSNTSLEIDDGCVACQG